MHLKIDHTGEVLPQNSLPVYAAGTTISVANFAELESAVTSTAVDGDLIKITSPISVTDELTVTKNITFTTSDSGKLTRDNSFTSGSIKLKM